MKAIVQQKRGKAFSTMQLQDMAQPKPGKREVRIRMVSSRINPVDMDLMKGFPGLKYKSIQPGGIDGAGEVLELGEGVSEVAVGDQVFFYRLFSDIGSWAQEITVPVSYLAKVPKNLSTEEAGAIALPLLTAFEALQSLQARAGERILIHGAGGGVGFQATQLARAMGLEVVANASERDQEAIMKVGVSRFINYKKESFAEVLQPSSIDYVFDVVGKDTLLQSIALKPKKVVSTTFPDTALMHKTGVALPGILKWLMNLMNRKYRKTAQKQGVKLLGQVTGANGKALQQASAMVEGIDYAVRPYKKISLSELENRNLVAKDVGSILVF